MFPQLRRCNKGIYRAGVDGLNTASVNSDFINGPASTSVGASIEGVRLLDPASGMADLYQCWIDRYNAEL